MELWPWASVSLFDGRVVNRGWLQELPDPTSGIVWGNYADIHPDKARSLGLADGDIVELACDSGKVKAAIRITEDVAENIVAISFGQGHTALGRNAANRGANVFELLGKAQNSSIFARVAISKTGNSKMPICAYATQEQHHREIIQWTNLSEVRHPKAESERFTLPAAGRLCVHAGCVSAACI